MTSDMDMYTVYIHPRDYRDGFVVRRWVITAGDAPKPMGATYHKTLKAAQLAIPRGRLCIPRNEDDDPAILETWV